MPKIPRSDREIMEKRKQLSLNLLAEGWSYNEIGKLFKVDKAWIHKQLSTTNNLTNKKHRGTVKSSIT